GPSAPRRDAVGGLGDRHGGVNLRAVSRGFFSPHRVARGRGPGRLHGAGCLQVDGPGAQSVHFQALACTARKRILAMRWHLWWVPHLLASAALFGTSQSGAAQIDVISWGLACTDSRSQRETFVEIAAGDYVTLARRSDGSVVAWGSNGEG